MAVAEQRRAAPLPRNVKALGVVSLLGDVASEMIYPLMPVFLTVTLGASATVLGAIEGLADSTSSLLKLASGWWADRVPKRKPIVVFGYALSAIARPLVGLAVASWQVLAVRMTDRMGKGIRTSPRDALLADSAAPEQRGRAYGLHRALDNVGAVLGPLVAWLLYEAMHRPIREVFLWSVVPGALSIVVLWVFVKESGPGSLVPGPGSLNSGLGTRDPGPNSRDLRLDGISTLGPAFWKYIAVMFVFTLGASSDAFLLIRAQQLGVPSPMIPIIYAMFNLVKSVSSVPGGTLSDRLGRRPLIVSGWALYAVVYLGFALASSEWHAWILFAIYGLMFGLTEGATKALVVDLVPASRRGTAFGWFNFAIGIAALPASLLFGVVSDQASPQVAFTMGAAFAAVATVGLIALVPRDRVLI
jgi:MFS family permease